MSKRVGWTACLGALLISWLATRASVAEGSNVWDGPYLGAQLGRATNSSCSRWLFSGAGLAVPEQAMSQSCGSGSFVGGVQVGENFQYEHVFWGLAADINIATGNIVTRSWSYNGTSLTAGTYFTSDRLNPAGFVILAPRIGYAGREWAPYLRAGGLVAFGGRDSSMAFKPVGQAQSTASFNGGKSFDTIGWVAGGGIDWGLYGPWSIGFEYLRASLGKGSSASASCAGIAAACEGFAGIAFENLHNAFTSDMFRIAVNYYFNYW
jgi:opacity protein-like surface antigen